MTTEIIKLFHAEWFLHVFIIHLCDRNKQKTLVINNLNLLSMAECKTVTLRTRPLKNGMISFYLDYYPGYREQETMKTIRHEGLNIYIYANPKNQRERDFNTTM